MPKFRKFRKYLYLSVIAAILYFQLSGYFRAATPGGGPANALDAVNLDAVSVAAWLWTPAWDMSPARAEELIAFADREKIRTIYLYAGDGISAQLRDQKDVVEKFIASAHRRNIAVEALGGDSEWSRPEYHATALGFFDAILAYNAAAAANGRFDGVQFDIEPYGQNNFRGRESQGLQDYLDLADRIVAKYLNVPALDQQRFRLGFTAPYWFDGENVTAITPWRNEPAKGAGLFLFDILNQIPHGYIALMDYRNYARGIDGSIAHAQGEIDYAMTAAPRVKVVVGQETTDAELPKLSFHDMNKDSLQIEMKRIAAAFGTKPVFGGFAIHNLESYMQLK